MPTLKPFRHVSVSQVQTWSTCRRKWWFQKVLDLPAEEKRHFVFGKALHSCAERYLLEQDPFLPGWADELTEEERVDIEELVTGGIEHGVLQRLPEQLVEHEFRLKFRDMPEFVGIIDHCSLSQEAPLVADHKTTGSLQWAKTVEDLRDDTQIVMYCFALLQKYRERHLKEPEKIHFRHNVFVKGLQGQSTALAKALGVDERPRWKIVGGVEDENAHLTSREIDQKAAECLLGVNSMKEDALLKDWRDFPDPPRSACEKYGGCEFLSICHAGMTTEDYEAYVTSTAKDAEMTDTPKNAASALARLKGKKKVTETESEENQEQEKEKPEQKQASVPPWYKPECKACAGSPNGPGFKKQTPTPCGICAMWAVENGLPAPDQFSIIVPSGGGRPRWAPKGDDPDLEVNGPLPEDLEEEPKLDLSKLNTKLEPEQEPIPLKDQPPRRGPGRPKGSKNKKRETSSEKEKPKPTTPSRSEERHAAQEEQPKAKGFILAINCMPLEDMLGSWRVIRLTDFFYGEASWVKEIAEGLGTPGVPWNGLDPFKRVDAACGLVPTKLEELDQTILVATTGPHEFRGLIEALRPHAKSVWVQAS